MKKKFFSLIMAISMAASLAIPAFAADNTATTTNIERIDYEDGSYVIVTTIQNRNVKANTTSGYKNYEYTDINGVKCWVLTLNGSFSYNYSSATATNASVSSIIYKSGWTVSNKNAYCSGATAYGSGTFSNGQTSKLANISLTCSPSGTVR